MTQYARHVKLAHAVVSAIIVLLFTYAIQGTEQLQQVQTVGWYIVAIYWFCCLGLLFLKEEEPDTADYSRFHLVLHDGTVHSYMTEKDMTRRLISIAKNEERSMLSAIVIGRKIPIDVSKQGQQFPPQV